MLHRQIKQYGITDLIPFVGYIDPTYWVYSSNSSSISA
nr:MAG TPA: hypothetical protein [Caudoviricetes sp.]